MLWDRSHLVCHVLMLFYRLLDLAHYSYKNVHYFVRWPFCLRQLLLVSLALGKQLDELLL